MKTTQAQLIAALIAVAPISARAGDALQLEPIFNDNGPQHSTCITGDPTPSLCIKLKEKSAAEWAEWTRKHVREIIDIKINNEIVSSPRLLSPMTGGTIPIAFKTEIDAAAAEETLRQNKSSLSVDQHDQ